MSILTTGCSAIKSAPETVIDTENHLEINKCYIEENPSIEKCDKSFNGTDSQWRDKVVYKILEIADLRFRDFKNDLSSEKTTLNIISDFALLGLASAGTLATGGTTNILAAASSGLVGARAAVDKEIYFSETLPGIISTMESSRKEILLTIVEKLTTLDHNQYSIERANQDIINYESAGTIPHAISVITGKAEKAKEKADEKLLEASLSMVTVSKETQDRKGSLFAYLREIESKGNKSTLDQIAEELNIPGNTDIKELGKAIRANLYSNIRNEQHVSSFSNRLFKITNKEF